MSVWMIPNYEIPWNIMQKYFCEKLLQLPGRTMNAGVVVKHKNKFYSINLTNSQIVNCPGIYLDCIW